MPKVLRPRVTNKRRKPQKSRLSKNGVHVTIGALVRDSCGAVGRVVFISENVVVHKLVEAHGDDAEPMAADFRHSDLEVLEGGEGATKWVSLARSVAPFVAAIEEAEKSGELRRLVGPLEASALIDGMVMGWRTLWAAAHQAVRDDEEAKANGGEQ